MSEESTNSTAARLRRIETRVTNLARWQGFDATKPPVNDPTQPVFVDECKVYAVPAATVGDVLLALRRANFPHEVEEVPLIVNGLEIGVLDPQVHLRFGEDYE